MSKANECLVYLQKRNWTELNNLLSNSKNYKELLEDPLFNIFETNLVSEIKSLENTVTDDLHIIVLERIIQLCKQTNQLKLSDNCVKEIAKYLFHKNPSENIAKLLPNDAEAINFLKSKINEATQIAKNTILAANLDIKIGEKGELIYSKKITNSPQEEELFRLASELLQNKLIYPNVALSVIISDKLLNQLTNEQKKFFFMSTIDLCVIDPNTLMPEFYFELDSAWHDKLKQIENDNMKDDIFSKAGLTLIRIRKKHNKTMRNEFELLLNKHAS
jgi:hypothetical protein